MADRIVTISASGGDYTTFALAIAGESDFQAGEDNIIFRYAGSVVDSNNITISGFTTTASHRVIIEVPVAHRHTLTINSGARVVCDAGWNYSLRISIPYVTINGLSIRNNSSNCRGVYINAANCILSNCLIANASSTQTEQNSVYCDNANNTVIVNCAIYGLYHGIYAYYTGTNVYVYDTTILNSGVYGICCDGWVNLTAKNCYAGSSGTYDYYKSSGSSLALTTCRSEDGSQSTSTVTLANCTFGSYTVGSEDVKIGSGSSLRSIGTDLSADSVYPVSTDALGNSRSSTPCIGAHEYASSINYIPAIINNHRQQGVM